MQDIEKMAKDEAKKHQEKHLEMKAGPMEPYVSLPYLTLNDKQLPEVKTWDVGKEYTLEVKVRMTGYSENKSLHMKQEDARGNFDVIGVGVYDDKPKKEDDADA